LRWCSCITSGNQDDQQDAYHEQFRAGLHGFPSAQPVILDYPFRLVNHPAKAPPEPKPSTNIPILAASETSDQNTIENTTAKTKNIIASANRFLPDLIIFYSFEI